ncbi:MAG: cutA [Gemmatimonadetes bacterium]|nr:cutA [Gemmatimonadota bacterium]
MAAPVGVIVTTSTDGEDSARRLAEAVVTERLAACVHVAGPVTSVYRWQGAVEQATEWTCSCKTTPAAAPALVARIRALHSYEVPEILVTPVVAGAPEYLAWIETVVRSQE